MRGKGEQGSTYVRWGQEEKSLKGPKRKDFTSLWDKKKEDIGDARAARSWKVVGLDDTVGNGVRERDGTGV